MKRHRRIYSALAVMLFLLVFIASCSQGSEKGKIIRAFSNQMELKSYTMNGNMELSQEHDNTVNRDFKIGVSFEGKYNKEPYYQVIDMNYDIMGLGMDVKIYTKDHEVWIKAPMYPEYLHIDTYEHMKKQDRNTENQNIFDERDRHKMEMEFFEILDEDKYSLASNKEKADLDVIAVDITNEDAQDLIKSFGELFVANLIPGVKMDFEETQNIFEIEELVVEIGINKKFVKYEEYSGILKLKDNNIENEHQKMKFNIIIEYDDFNKKLDFNFPDFEGKDIINYNELFGIPMNKME
ncbi:MAG TPA: hypothetical protein GX526_01750 [Thermoanaerobacterales bacterium]|nr:hypothetical protein [Thermoanaerobacterales bacterium]